MGKRQIFVISLTLICIVLLDGCCGTRLWRPESQQRELQFEVHVPMEIQYNPAEDAPLRIPLLLLNGPNAGMCIAKKDSDDQWRYGVVPVAWVDVGDAPVDPNSWRVEFSAASGRALSKGRELSSDECVRLENTSFIVNEPQDFYLEFQVNPHLASSGTLTAYVGFRHPNEQSNNAYAARCRITISIRESGRPTLFSRPGRFIARATEIP